MLHRRWFPDRIDGTLVVLKRHTRDNLPDFMRWYTDPEVARLTRYQDGPDAPGRDRAVLHDAGARVGHDGDGDPHPADRAG